MADHHFDDCAFPYPYGSDLHWLWGWGYRIGKRLEHLTPPTDFAPAFFRPDRLAARAIMRLGVRFPTITAALQTAVADTEELWERLQHRPTAESAEELSLAMESLRERISWAVEIIADHEMPDGEAAKPAPRTVPAEVEAVLGSLRKPELSQGEPATGRSGKCRHPDKRTDWCRDHAWLDIHEQANMSHSDIAEWWNGLSADERKRIACERSSDRRVTREVVKNGAAKARRERRNPQPDQSGTEASG